MAIVSLFSGIGGLELGLEWAGLGPTLAQVELDPWCRAVLEMHWPHAERFTDVRELDAAALPVADVWCGGFPCQDISSANPNGAGLDGARSGLWFQFHRLLAEVRRRPRAVVVENVGRLARRGLDRVASGLHDLGYEVEVTRILAADVGAPYRRERCFLVGVADGDLRGREGVWFEEHAALRRALWAEPHGRREGRRGEGTAPSVVDGGVERLEVAVAAPEAGQLEAGRGAAAGAGGQARRPPPPEPRVGRDAAGLPWWVDGAGPGAQWPAPRGAPQATWEAPRTVKRVQDRPQRLKALGNAVVPQVAYVVGLRLRERLGYDTRL